MKWKGRMLRLEAAPEQPGGAPAPAGGTSGQDDLPAWLTKLSGAELEDAKGHIFRQRDYTQKTQEVADLRKLKDKYKDRDFEKDLAEVDQWREWRKGAGSEYEKQLARLEELERVSKAAPADAAPTGDSGAYRVTTEDFFEQQRLEKALDAIESRASQRAYDRWQKDYQEKEVPRLDRVAANYLNTVVGLLKVAWPKDAPPISDLLREAAVRQNGDFMKIAEDITSQAEGLKKGGYDEGYKKGLEEANRAAAPGPAPAGGSIPSWKRPTGGAKQDRASMFQDVMKSVEKKHGAIPY